MYSSVLLCLFKVSFGMEGFVLNMSCTSVIVGLCVYSHNVCARCLVVCIFLSFIFQKGLHFVFLLFIRTMQFLKKKSLHLSQIFGGQLDPLPVLSLYFIICKVNFC